MLFDLQGKRRRLVQATYLILAVLMGGGLVLFGIGSGDVSGGLFDAITGKDSNSTSNNSAVNSRIKKDLAALKVNPKNSTALADLIRAHYQLAADDTDVNTGAFGEDGKQELSKADTYWKRYVKVTEKPNDSLASLMLQAYGSEALNKPADAAAAAEIIAASRPSAQAYLALAQYASQAGQTRKADLAGQKAVDLAPKSQKKLVKQQLDAMKAQAGAAATTQTSG